eukprot:9548022-Lingulodinium_polyedra.AAC.1
MGTKQRREWRRGCACPQTIFTPRVGLRRVPALHPTPPMRCALQQSPPLPRSDCARALVCEKAPA